MLGIESGSLIPEVRGWIVDTSIEHDHQRFDGFLKISVEEIIIALRDDRRLLNDHAGILNGQILKTQSEDVTACPALKSLYPNEFSALRFFEVIETEEVWGEALSLI